ncbi:nacrein-like protein [Saccostrea cucullata]|uniref:nacrein-like protein n=1 Tax=Saccostrea cuccullata TaxID=36930 RepID=UPI002ED0300E
MSGFGQVVVLALCFVGTVYCVGYIGKRPPSQGACYYEDINAAHFSYEMGSCEGPRDWCSVNKCWTTCGSDRRQSPININSHRTERRYFRNLELKNLNQRANAEIFNNGHSPHFDVNVDTSDDDNNIILTRVPGRPSYKRYIFAQLHVHLGHDEDKGSEHSINDRFYPMEAHMVFYDSMYSDIGHAKFAPDGLVVLGVMLEPDRRGGEDSDDSDDSDESDEDDDNGYNDNGERRRNLGCPSENGDEDHGYFRGRLYRGHGECRVRFARTLSKIMEKYYKKIRKHNAVEPDTAGADSPPDDLQCGRTPSYNYINNNCFKKEAHHDDMVNVECGISPADVLPYDQRFYTYAGSLTTPPCYETVQWIVFKCPVMVTKKAFKRLQEVEDSHKDPLKMIGIRRPIQRNRYVRVYRNF